MMAEAPTLLLDLTRSLRRSGRMATGVDRVELAYLEHFISMPTAVFGIVRTPFGYVLIDRSGMAAFHKRLTGQDSGGRIGFLSRLVRGRPKEVQQTETEMRRTAVARARRGQLPQMLARCFPQGGVYFNVGHSNLTERMLQGVKGAGLQINVLIHDVIPLEYPHYQRPGTIEPFEEKLRQVGAHADRIIYNSEDTRSRTEAILASWESEAPGIVAHLGTMKPMPNPAELPADLPPGAPFFMVVGTIEPRKNHGFLLDLWEEMGASAPHLLICGSRGWNNEAVFARLDALPPDSPIKEIPDLSDGALAALLRQSAGLLFPSHAEGFGLPPVEALALGTRVLCNDLAVLREILGEKAVYAAVSERYLWHKTIKSWAQNPQIAEASGDYVPPTWDDHFKAVLRLS